jgi:DNA-binding NarL/FixJ family response regulator
VITVLVVDDEPMVCAHLRAIFEVEDDLTVVGTASDGAAAVEAVMRHRPRVVLMDLRMPGVGGLTAISHVTKLPVPPAVLAMTTFDTGETVVRAMAAGAVGYLVKTTPPAQIVAMIRAAASGVVVLSQTAAGRLLAGGDAALAARERLGSLTTRESEVLACLGSGMSNAAIASRLKLAETTVKGHVSRLLAKLHCENRTQAGLLAQRATAKSK